MKKALYAFCLIMTLGIITSCSEEKCYECTLVGIPATTYCEGDFASATEFEAFIDISVAAGSTCVVK